MPAKRKFTDEEREIAIRMYRDGKSMRAIRHTLIAMTGPVKDETIARMLRENGVEIRVGGARIFPPSVERRIVADYNAGSTMKAMTKRYKCSAWTIQQTVKRYGGQIRPRGGKGRQFTNEELTLMEQMASAGKSQYAIAQVLNANPATINGVMRQHGIRPNQHQSARGERHGHWKGGRTQSSQGYCMVRLEPGDPLAVMAQQGAYVMEHRLVMARHLGRALERHETVHHINGDKTDNRIENLQLRQGKHGNGAAYVCLDCGSHNVAPKELT